ncbi:hypothetical protein HU200_026335 [Digitaria exilis]|uniref:Transcription repressor n=1 Tax=Digitaria exilis TaxID=1010633 RepID=A0A835C9A0_9POAL|nr:hypothetical protein HU200_026335 [Digitaria exilis]
MDKNRLAHAKPGGHGVGGRLRQRLAQFLRHSSCATTSATAFVGVATTTNAAAPPPTATNNAASRQQEHHEPQPKVIHGRRQRRHHRRRSSSSRALVHISIDCSAATSVVSAAAVLPSPAPAARDAVKSGTRKKGDGYKLRSPLYSWSSSSSSTDTDDGELAPFSSDGEKGQTTTTDTRSTLFSSRSFSSDSTVDFYSNATGGSSTTKPRRHKKTPRHGGARKPAGGAFRRTAASAAAGDNEHEKEKKKKPVVDDRKDGGGSGAAVAGGGSTAVVKRSHNPYADFRSSMVEMVAGRRLRGADALAELLVWYLSLNSPRHHPAILAAFEDVWEAVLGNDP